jgi:MFS transporter, DHA2 family, multidrug resistance protein
VGPHQLPGRQRGHFACWAALHQTEIGANVPHTCSSKSPPPSPVISPAQARPGSFGLLYGLMEQQSALMAYVDVFRWTAVLAFLCAAAVWLFKKPIKYAALPPGMH